MSSKNPRPCTVCGRTLDNTPFPNKSAICRLCRRKWEKMYPDRYWDKKHKCWLMRKEYGLLYLNIQKYDDVFRGLTR